MVPRTQGTRKLLNGVRRFCVVTAFVSLVGSMPTGAEAMGEIPTEAQDSRFEDLLYSKLLTCEVWGGWQIGFRALDTKSPELALEELEGPGEESEPFVLLFNMRKPRAILFGPSYSVASLTEIVMPKGGFLAATDGRIELALSSIEYLDQTCLPSSTPCTTHLQIFADPEYQTVFPFIISEFSGASDRGSFIFAGRCMPRVSDQFWRDEAEYVAGLMDRANCGDAASQMDLGASGLLRAVALGGDLVEPYRWLAIAGRGVAEEGATEDQEFAFEVRTAMDIAANHMTPEQIAEAERLAAEWAPDPAECESAPEPGAPEGAKE